MAQITYANKVALNENPEIAAINKVSDDDMNEIKQVVNNNYNNTIQISNTEPTDSDNKIWINNGELNNVTEITNGYSTSTGIGYSANYTNNLFNWEHRTVSLIPNTSPTSNYGTCDLYINHTSKIVYFIIKHTTLAYESGANGVYYTKLKPYSTDSSTHLEFPIVIDKDTIGRMQLRADGGFRVYAVKAGTFVGQGMFVYDEELTS